MSSFSLAVEQSKYEEGGKGKCRHYHWLENRVNMKQEEKANVVIFIGSRIE